jgi:hypothetical protein
MPGRSMSIGLTMTRPACPISMGDQPAVRCEAVAVKIGPGKSSQPWQAAIRRPPWNVAGMRYASNTTGPSGSNTRSRLCRDQNRTSATVACGRPATKLLFLQRNRSFPFTSTPACS